MRLIESSRYYLAAAYLYSYLAHLFPELNSIRLLIRTSVLIRLVMNAKTVFLQLKCSRTPRGRRRYYGRGRRRYYGAAAQLAFPGL